MNTTLTVAFLAGLISFLSPCVLPLIPGYISYISGTSFQKIIEKRNNLVAIKTIFFTLGFSLVFICLGSTATLLGKFFLNNSNILKIIAGLIIIFFSLQFIGIVNLKFMNRDIRIFTNQYSDNLLFPLIVGIAFGFGWTPCIGPILGSILALAAIKENVSESILLLSFYSLGLAIPFIISGILINKFLFFSKGFNKYLPIVKKSGGIILFLTGIAILTDQLQILGFFILEYFPSLSYVG
ncbi:cytochrome c biogenesis protein CcdA [Pelagibacteraceae bacterium]|nr:cytochrome c biogenesis protein CcdA [Pelagibacteraceae bacterium]